MKRRLRDGGTALGSMVFEFKTPGIGPAAAGAGVDFLIFDMEHTGWHDETVGLLIATARSTDVVPLVRVPGKDYHLLSRPLDLGALGLMVPMVENADQARELVAAMKYPPLGRRGAAFGIPHDDYVIGDLGATMSSANDEGLLICQIENVAGLDQVEEIAAVDGVDVLWLGHFDLTASMGIPGQFDDQRYLDGVARIAAAADKHGKSAGYMATSTADGRAMLDRGFRALAYWGDVWIYQRALADGLQDLRDHLGR